MRLIKAFTASVMIHLLIFCAGYGLITWWKHSSFSAVDIDLAGSSLLLRPSGRQGKARPVITVQDWYMSGSKFLAAIPVKVTAAAAEETTAAACPAPCPDNSSDWAPAGASSRKPVWTEGMITEDDYPKDARAQGKEGMVKVEIYIDAQGAVRDARVLQSNDARFSALVLEKLRKARFEPALDMSGKPIAVHMAVPIIFELH